MKSRCFDTSARSIKCRVILIVRKMQFTTPVATLAELQLHKPMRRQQESRKFHIPPHADNIFVVFCFDLFFPGCSRRVTQCFYGLAALREEHTLALTGSSGLFMVYVHHNETGSGGSLTAVLSFAPTVRSAPATCCYIPSSSSATPDCDLCAPLVFHPFLQLPAALSSKTRVDQISLWRL